MHRKSLDDFSTFLHVKYKLFLLGDQKLVNIGYIIMRFQMVGNVALIQAGSDGMIVFQIY